MIYFEHELERDIFICSYHILKKRYRQEITPRKNRKYKGIQNGIIINDSSPLNQVSALEAAVRGFIGNDEALWLRPLADGSLHLCAGMQVCQPM